MKIGIKKEGKSIMVVKDFQDAGLVEIGLVLAEVEILKNDLLNLFNKKKNG